MQGQDEVLLVGVHKVDPPPQNIQLNADEIANLIGASIFAEFAPGTSDWLKLV